MYTFKNIIIILILIIIITISILIICPKNKSSEHFIQDDFNIEINYTKQPPGVTKGLIQAAWNGGNLKLIPKLTIKFKDKDNNDKSVKLPFLCQIPKRYRGYWTGKDPEKLVSSLYSQTRTNLLKGEGLLKWDDWMISDSEHTGTNWSVEDPFNMTNQGLLKGPNGQDITIPDQQGKQGATLSLKSLLNGPVQPPLWGGNVSVLLPVPGCNTGSNSDKCHNSNTLSGFIPNKRATAATCKNRTNVPDSDDYTGSKEDCENDGGTYDEGETVAVKLRPAFLDVNPNSDLYNEPTIIPHDPLTSIFHVVPTDLKINPTADFDRFVSPKDKTSLWSQPADKTPDCKCLIDIPGVHETSRGDVWNGCDEFADAAGVTVKDAAALLNKGCNKITLDTVGSTGWKDGVKQTCETRTTCPHRSTNKYLGSNRTGVRFASTPFLASYPRTAPEEATRTPSSLACTKS